MSESVLSPTAPTTLVIVLGASAWPNSPGFQGSEAFVQAAQGFKEYMLNPRGFCLPKANLFYLFNEQSSASDQLEKLGSFLEKRTQMLKSANQAARDVLVYFVGHGGFAGPSADFYLMHRRANANSLRASGIAIDALAEVLREKARQTRRYLFLDCCFAAAAFRSFQGGPDRTAITKTLDAFHVQTRSSGFPRKGTVLLCSSDQKSPSLLLPDESCTMFSHALLDVLRNGDPHRSPQLSLRDLKELAGDRLAALSTKNAPRPGLHSPDQSEGDVADVPFFPNPCVEEERQRHNGQVRISSLDSRNDVLTDFISIGTILTDQEALLAFVDNLIIDANIANFKPEYMLETKRRLLRQVNEAIHSQLLNPLSDKEARALEKLLIKNASDKEIYQFLMRKIPNLELKIAQVLQKFRKDYLFLWKLLPEKEQ